MRRGDWSSAFVLVKRAMDEQIKNGILETHTRPDDGVEEAKFNVNCKIYLRGKIERSWKRSPIIENLPLPVISTFSRRSQQTHYTNELHQHNRHECHCLLSLTAMDVESMPVRRLWWFDKAPSLIDGVEHCIEPFVRWWKTCILSNLRLCIWIQILWDDLRSLNAESQVVRRRMGQVSFKGLPGLEWLSLGNGGMRDDYDGFGVHLNIPWHSSSSSRHR